MKKKKLHGLSLNKKSIVNFSTIVGGNNIVTGPTDYKGCVPSIVDCILTERCATGINCDTILCTTVINCEPQTTVLSVCIC